MYVWRKKTHLGLAPAAKKEHNLNPRPRYILVLLLLIDKGARGSYESGWPKSHIPLKCLQTASAWLPSSLFADDILECEAQPSVEEPRTCQGIESAFAKRPGQNY